METPDRKGGYASEKRQSGPVTVSVQKKSLLFGKVAHQGAGGEGEATSWRGSGHTNSQKIRVNKEKRDISRRSQAGRVTSSISVERGEIWKRVLTESGRIGGRLVPNTGGFRGKGNLPDRWAKKKVLLGRAGERMGGTASFCV